MHVLFYVCLEELFQKNRRDAMNMNTESFKKMDVYSAPSGLS